MDAPTIKLGFSDAMIFPTEVRVAKLFVTIEKKLEFSAVEDDENAVVPLRSVAAKQLQIKGPMKLIHKFLTNMKVRHFFNIPEDVSPSVDGQKRHWPEESVLMGQSGVSWT
ncbi:GM22705 [Drosophila sechellia]|uniref:GM22705 n=1 Tax=Drosophila sechellia TaxID=7238 RepID=B4I7C5_DROSE|nr:GM22705 [Drosophila sechellia]